MIFAAAIHARAIGNSTSPRDEDTVIRRERKRDLSIDSSDTWTLRDNSDNRLSCKYCFYKPMFVTNTTDTYTIYRNLITRHLIVRHSLHHTTSHQTYILSSCVLFITVYFIFVVCLFYHSCLSICISRHYLIHHASFHYVHYITRHFITFYTSHDNSSLLMFHAIFYEKLNII